MYVTLMQRWLARQNRNPLRSALLVAAFIAVPTAVRIGLEPWVGFGVRFATYYPAILMAGLVLGLRGGMAVWLLSGIVSFLIFVPPDASSRNGMSLFVGLAIFYACSGIVFFAAIALRTALLRLQAAHEREYALNMELRHRIKNFLAIVQSLVSQTARHTQDPAMFQEKLFGRLTAYRDALDLLAEREWRLCELPSLPETVLAPFTASGRILFDGPACTIAPEAAEGLALALHELATNAIKYGALSTPEGLVEVRWELTDGAAGQGRQCALTWQERGGPPVSKPARTGLGTRLIRPQRGIPAVSLDYPENGVVCTLMLSLAPQQPGEAPERPAFTGSFAMGRGPYRFT